MVNVEIINVIISVQLDQAVNTDKWEVDIKNITGVQRISMLNNSLFHVHTTPKDVFELISIVSMIFNYSICTSV